VRDFKLKEWVSMVLSGSESWVDNDTATLPSEFW
jgi:hypothetical protein